MSIFEENELGELVKKPLLIIFSYEGQELCTISNTWEYLEFRNDLTMVTFPRFFYVSGKFIWIQSKEELDKLFTVVELPKKIFKYHISTGFSLNDFYPIDSPN